jgi:hypothetical protein
MSSAHAPARTPRLRPRDDRDLPACVEALAEVHEADGYPTNWPERPAGWLSGTSLVGAWVAELDGRVAGHIALCRAEADDVAPVLWSGREGVPVEATGVVSRLFVAPGPAGTASGRCCSGGSWRRPGSWG